MESTAASHPRRIEGPVVQDLQAKMVFVAGPRQCGKTTMAETIGRRTPSAYFSWDVGAHRRQLREGLLPEPAKLWILDELHKYRSWRSWLKGTYDVHRRRHQILVTGSGRLDAYSHGGDSLQGRYFLHRMHPFTLSELLGIPVAEDVERIPLLDRRVQPSATRTLEDLARLGGFPEPFLAGSDRTAARWRMAYGERLVREDLRDLERMRDLDRIELLYERLPATVGSVLSMNALREDLEVAFGTVKSWLSMFERLYAVFRVAPFGPPRIKAVKKEQKAYLWDWARVEHLPQRFENLVMLHLLRLVHWIEDHHGERAELRYFRTEVGHEVDAVVLRRGKPWMAVEIKLDDRPLDPSLKYLLERVAIPHAFQVSLRGRIDARLPNIGRSAVRLVPAWKFLAHLP